MSIHRPRRLPCPKRHSNKLLCEKVNKLATRLTGSWVRTWALCVSRWNWREWLHVMSSCSSVFLINVITSWLPNTSVLQFDPFVTIQQSALAKWSTQRQGGPAVALVANRSCYSARPRCELKAAWSPDYSSLYTKKKIILNSAKGHLMAGSVGFDYYDPFSYESKILLNIFVTWGNYYLYYSSSNIKLSFKILPPEYIWIKCVLVKVF